MIDSYSFGRIVIDGKEYIDDLIIFPDHIQDNWWRKEGHTLHLEDLEEVLEAEPEVLIVGTGASGKMSFLGRAREKVESHEIEVIVKKTGKASETYNEISEERETVAALHLTC